MQAHPPPSGCMRVRSRGRARAGRTRPTTVPGRPDALARANLPFGISFVREHIAVWHPRTTQIRRSASNTPADKPPAHRQAPTKRTGKPTAHWHRQAQASEDYCTAKQFHSSKHSVGAAKATSWERRATFWGGNHRTPVLGSSESHSASTSRHSIKHLGV